MIENKENSNINIQTNSLSKETSKNQTQKKPYKEKKSSKKLSTESQVKVIPLLKPPSKRRKFDKNGKIISEKKEKNQTGIKWDNKTIQEQCLDKKQHLKIKEEKTLYPDGDNEDLYEEAVNKVNEIKATEEIINNVIEVLNDNKEIEEKLKNKQLKKRTYNHKYSNSLKFNNNCIKFDNLSGENKICLQNTLINKFHKEFRSLSKGKV